MRKKAKNALKKFILSGAIKVPTNAVTITRPDNRGFVKSTTSDKKECE